jgi:hypothetical protein
MRIVDKVSSSHSGNMDFNVATALSKVMLISLLPERMRLLVEP